LVYVYFSSSGYVTWNDGMINEQWIAENVGGTCRVSLRLCSYCAGVYPEALMSIANNLLG